MQWRHHASQQHAVQLCRTPGTQTPAQLAATLWALAKKRASEPNYIGRALQECDQRILEFTNNELQCVLWAVGTLEPSNRPLVRSLSWSIVRRNRQHQRAPHCFGNMYWVLAITGCLQGELAYALTDSVAKSVRTLRDRDVAGVTWACAVSQLERPSLMKAMTTQWIRTIFEFSSRHLANTAWALTKVAAPWHTEMGVANRFWAAVTGQLEQLQPKEFASLMWSAARSLVTLPEGNQRRRIINRPMALAADQRLGAQEMTNLVWSFAQLSFLQGSDRDPLCEHMFGEAARRFGSLAPRHITNLLWASAVVRAHHSPFLLLAKQAIAEQGDMLNTLELVNVAWAFAKLSSLDADKWVPLCHLRGRLGELTGQGLANVLWAMAAAQLAGNQQCSSGVWLLP
ncbi:unnamed protein product [Effrenium voratum]|nr:unnamed protein product [Effrenium voratum]